MASKMYVSVREEVSTVLVHWTPFSLFQFRDVLFWIARLCVATPLADAEQNDKRKVLETLDCWYRVK